MPSIIARPTRLTRLDVGSRSDAAIPRSAKTSIFGALLSAPARPQTRTGGIRLLPNEDGELRAADADLPTNHTAVERYLAKAFGDNLAEVLTAMEGSPHDLFEIAR
jgi:hypothetical protein